MLQGLHLVPSALLDRLHDTRLEPTNVAPDLPPGQGMPGRRKVGGRTSNFGSCCHLLVPFGQLVRVSRDGRPEGSQPACAVRGTTPLSAPLPGGRCFLPPPLPAPPSAPLAICFAVRGGCGFPPFRRRLGVGKVVPLGRWRVICGRGPLSPGTWPRTLLVQA